MFDNVLVKRAYPCATQHNKNFLNNHVITVPYHRKKQIEPLLDHFVYIPISVQLSFMTFFL